LTRVLARILFQVSERDLLTFATVPCSSPTPMAFQITIPGQVNLSASFAIRSATNFGLVIQGVDPILPLHVSMRVGGLYLGMAFSSSRQTSSDAAGNTVVAATVADAAGKDAPFPELAGVGCGHTAACSIPCSDVAIYKYSAAGAPIVLRRPAFLPSRFNPLYFVGIRNGTRKPRRG
jgi:hypothetical protein